MPAAKITNPRKKFNFDIEFSGAPTNISYLAQEVELPEITIEQVSHGEANRDVKTAGRISVGNCTIRCLKRTNQTETWFWDWAMMCQDISLGGGNVTSAYWKDVIITELAEDGVTIVDKWFLTECWPTQISSLSLARNSSDNTIQEIVLSVGIIDNSASKLGNLTATGLF